VNAIITRFIRYGVIIAHSGETRITVPGRGVGAKEMHANAARELANRLGWTGDIISGEVAIEGMGLCVHALITKELELEE